MEKEQLEYYKKWRKKNKTHLLEYHRQWRSGNRVKIRKYQNEYMRIWRQKNKEHVQEYSKEYNKVHKEILAKNSRKFREEHRDELRIKRFLYGYGWKINDKTTGEGFLRGDGCCLVCGEIDPFTLELHHLFNTDNPRITLCSNCHRALHKFSRYRKFATNAWKYILWRTLE